jgi:hypothetical protein
VEDTETSYWGVASDGTDYGSTPTGKGGVIEYMKGECDSVSEPCSNVDYIHFYKGVIILKKK